MKIFKCREVKTLDRGTEFSAGIDFFIPVFTNEFLDDLKEKNPKVTINGSNMFIEPHDRILIPSGIKVNIPDDHVFIMFNKSGVSSKKGLDVLASVIDQDYCGEIHISLVNTTSSKICISENEKIIQAILLPISYEDIEEVDSEIECFTNKDSNRGDGGFGSTNKK